MRPIAPRASYRLQLRAGVGFAEARRRLPYLARLGVSHLYLSPVMRARSDSTHGYDVADPREVDPALGGLAGLRALARAARRHGIGLLLDVVPSHAAAHPENPAFEDVLRHGRRSSYARWFDVDWDEPGAGGRVVLPFLPAPLAACSEDGALGVETRGGEPRLRCGGLRLPLAPGSLDAVPRAARDLRRLLARQAYRLVHWRDAARWLNYRRFFDIDDLIALRADDASVFRETHARVAQLVADGTLDGLRVDHVDGIGDPAGYLRRLRRLAPGRWLLVEKILARDEALPRDWPVDGTTGYEVAAALEELFLDAPGVVRIERGFARATRLRAPFGEVAVAGRRAALRGGLAPDLRRLARRFGALLARRAAPRPPARELRAALVEALVHWPAYRTYPSARGLSPADRRRTRAALAAARAAGRATPRALAALRWALAPGGLRDPERLAFAVRFQQLAAPVAAKGVEDTAFYVHVPLLSRNEVGSHPEGAPRRAAARLHAANAERARRWPRAQLTVSTHDTKRSADVRARLDVLSERPGEWLALAAGWRRRHAALRRRVGGGRWPDAHSEYVLYQTLVGVWPLPTRAGGPGAAALRALRGRVAGAMQKSTREAGRRTSWTRPNAGFEAALRDFGDALLSPDDPAGRVFLPELESFVRRVAWPGLWNALARSVVQLAAPGVPDLYQGDELWRFSLVDPDNRRPVDFAAAEARLREVERGRSGSRRERAVHARALLRRSETGALKLHVLHGVLQARRRHPELFARGRYRALEARGPRARHVFAFARERPERRGGLAVALVPRLTVRLLDDVPDRAEGAPADLRHAPVGREVWGDTVVLLPRAVRGRRLRDAFGGASTRCGRDGRLPVGDALAELPVALLLG